MNIEAATWKEDLLRSMFNDAPMAENRAIPIGLPSTKDKLVWENNI